MLTPEKKGIAPSLLDVYLDDYKGARFVFAQPLPKAASGCVITAFNPYGRKVGIRKNRCRHGLLIDAIRHFRYTKGFGGDKQMQYREASVFVYCHPKLAWRYLRRFQQNGVYLVRRGELHLLLADGRELKLGCTLGRRIRKRPDLPRLNRAQAL
ncbi:DUF3293 domain-containing protein [Pseudoalteromonas sp. BDTF-M6]|uniref:DUF3293 domain-containing protein n=1 Tax=Pseudoalteromonas sp. BDTF-M6 TaxID=2796132 RepID=UPI001BAFAEA9|nr:DUF3293 domain-containing protein [Pseudoalteromonas sp. BDTF-M6]MBS3799043.1 DUF3293 domain-containing protein [Pseudoalteromonas sp. BDTF-M6]